MKEERNILELVSVNEKKTSDLANFILFMLIGYNLKAKIKGKKIELGHSQSVASGEMPKT